MTSSMHLAAPARGHLGSRIDHPRTARRLQRALGLVALGLVAFVAPIEPAGAVSRCAPGGTVNAAGTCDCAKGFVSAGPSGAAHCVVDPKKAAGGLGVGVKPIKPGTQLPGTLPADAGATVSIKGGQFVEGSSDSTDADAGPVHPVTVSDFKIDKYEVSVAEYERCVKAKICPEPPKDLETLVVNGTRCNWPARKAHPMNCVTWTEANDYCNSKSKRLPTEAEWEYAAKGGSKGNVFPWGGGAPSCKLANYTAATIAPGCGDGTSPIGAHAAGASAFGVNDLAGNVEEWTMDWWGSYSGLGASAPNPYDADSKAGQRTIKGGSWDLSTPKDLHVVRREAGEPTMRQNWLGFRCAVGPNPVPAPEMYKKSESAPPPVAAPQPPPPAPKVPAPGDLGTMIKVPGGAFTMGLDGDQDAGPAHLVTLSPYLIDKYEVTVGDYKKCVDGGKCVAPLLLSSQTCNWGVAGREGHPINCVEWSDAKRYCTSVGKRLPTEAEWELASRGPTNRTFPWGTSAPTCATAAFFPKDKQQCASSTQVVGSHPAGQSYFGAFDMGGNVEEWVFDFWDNYGGGPANNPTGPATGDNHVVRGGNWKGPEEYMHSYGRFGPKMAMDWIGFRCAKTP